jgi:hypothetical protein
MWLQMGLAQKVKETISENKWHHKHLNHELHLLKKHVI